MDKIKFIDLFAGIGGFRYGLEQNEKYKCVFSSEIDKECQIVYEKNFKDKPFNDVTKINPNELPDFDILTAGFPCQPFSISGLKKGFEDTRGTLFFDICRIIEKRNPKVIILENVKNLIYHDKGKTFKTIIKVIKNLNYNVNWEILNSKDFNVPQNRERIIIIGTKKSSFDFSKLKKYKERTLEEFIITKYNKNFLNKNEYTIIEKMKKQKSGLIFAGYLNNKTIRKKGIKENTLHLSRVHRQPNRIYSVKGTHPTLSSMETSGRYYIYFPNTDKVRKLSIEECYKIMGFKENFIKSTKKTQQYKQIGNSVVIPMIKEIGEEIINQKLI